MRALSNSPGLGFVHFGALDGVGTGQRVSTACKCFKKCRLWLIIETTSNAHSFFQPHLPTSAGNADLCARPSVLKVAVIAAAAEFLRLAGESLGGVMLLNGYDKESLAAICKLKVDASRARSSAAVKAVSATDLPDFKRFVETQYAIGLNNTNGKSRCDADARKAIGNGPWARICLLAAAVDSSGVVKELHAQGEAAFVAEVGDKARLWWSQSRNSEAAKMKSAWRTQDGAVLHF
jgi:hypothetical protein